LYIGTHISEQPAASNFRKNSLFLDEPEKRGYQVLGNMTVLYQSTRNHTPKTGIFVNTDERIQNPTQFLINLFNETEIII
jgi:hypothetical protein